jgi:hypothetical protein
VARAKKASFAAARKRTAQRLAREAAIKRVKKDREEEVARLSDGTALGPLDLKRADRETLSPLRVGHLDGQVLWEGQRKERSRSFRCCPGRTQSHAYGSISQLTPHPGSDDLPEFAAETNGGQTFEQLFT